MAYHQFFEAKAQAFQDHKQNDGSKINTPNAGDNAPQVCERWVTYLDNELRYWVVEICPSQLE